MKNRHLIFILIFLSLISAFFTGCNPDGTGIYKNIYISKPQIDGSLENKASPQQIYKTVDYYYIDLPSVHRKAVSAFSNSEVKWEPLTSFEGFTEARSGASNGSIVIGSTVYGGFHFEKTATTEEKSGVYKLVDTASGPQWKPVTCDTTGSDLSDKNVGGFFSLVLNTGTKYFARIRDTATTDYKIGLYEIELGAGADLKFTEVPGMSDKTVLDAATDGSNVYFLTQENILSYNSSLNENTSLNISIPAADRSFKYIHYSTAKSAFYVSCTDTANKDKIYKVNGTTLDAVTAAARSYYFDFYDYNSSVLLLGTSLGYLELTGTDFTEPTATVTDQWSSLDLKKSTVMDFSKIGTDFFALTMGSGLWIKNTADSASAWSIK